MKALRICPPPLRSSSPRYVPAKRTFITPPSFVSPPKQNLTASRTLPYPPKAIYSIIADVNSYSTFLPFCERSTVTKWSRPTDNDGTKWPSEAELIVGWKGISEAFTSRIYCVPGRIVEAVGGGTPTSLPADEIRHHDGAATLAAQDQSVLSHLLTRWTVSPAASAVGGSMGREETKVDLAIEFQFSNPIYSAMSSAVADKVAGFMIEAFESRVKQVLKDKDGQVEIAVGR